MTTEERPDYLSYLLRLWRINGEGRDWRISIVSPHTGECKNFTSLEALWLFLREQMEIPSGEGQDGE